MESGVAVYSIEGGFVCLHVTGYIGIVKDATEDTARVELHSSCKTISVDKSRLSTLTYVSVCLSVCLSVSLFLCHFPFLCLCVSFSVCLPLCVSASLSLSMRVYVSLSVSASFSLSLCLPLSVSASISLSLCVSLRVCLCLFLSLSLSLSVSLAVTFVKHHLPMSSKGILVSILLTRSKTNLDMAYGKETAKSSVEYLYFILFLIKKNDYQNWTIVDFIKKEKKKQFTVICMFSFTRTTFFLYRCVHPTPLHFPVFLQSTSIVRSTSLLKTSFGEMTR